MPRVYFHTYDGGRFLPTDRQGTLLLGAIALGLARASKSRLLRLGLRQPDGEGLAHA
jgi:hypothetical protein